MDIPAQLADALVERRRLGGRSNLLVEIPDSVDSMPLGLAIAGELSKRGFQRIGWWTDSPTRTARAVTESQLTQPRRNLIPLFSPEEAAEVDFIIVDGVHRLSPTAVGNLVSCPSTSVVAISLRRMPNLCNQHFAKRMVLQYVRN